MACCPTVWLLAPGPNDEVYPIELNDAQRRALATLGLQPPVVDGSATSHQGDAWWLQIDEPSDPLLAEGAGHLLTVAARRVYGVEDLAAISWYGLGLGDRVHQALEALPIAEGQP